MDEDKWNEFLALPTVKEARGFTLQAVTQLLQRKCGLRLLKIMIKDALDLRNCADPMIVQVTPSHGIAFYKDMIFDANNEGPKKRQYSILILITICLVLKGIKHYNHS